MPDLELIGRVDELALARGMLRHALEGVPGVLLVGGEAGVGRSRLVAKVAAEASAMGFRPAMGACVRMDSGALTYAAIVGALRGLVAMLDPGEVASTLGAYRHEIVRLLPEVSRLAPDPRAAPADESLARLRLFEAITSWLNRLAERAPLLLVVEDLHWADAATLDLVRSLAVGCSGRTVLVVTLRTDEGPSPTVRGTIAELVRDGAERIELQPFDRAELARLAAESTGTTPGDVPLDRLLERTGGNAFLAVELIEAGLLEPGADEALVPRVLRDILDARLAALDGDVLDVVRAAALHPGPIDDGLLARVLDRPVREVGTALRDAAQAGILGPAAGSVGFRHALQREVLVERLGPGERRSLHAAYANALADLGDPAGTTAAAWHRDAAGDGPAALTAHVEALAVAMDTSAFEAAAAHGARAAALRATEPAAGGPDVAALLEQASLAALLAGDPAGAAWLARQALSSPGGRDDLIAATLHERVRWALWEAGDRAGSAAELALAFERLGDAPAPAMRARLQAERAAMHMDDADPGPAMALCEDALRLAREAGARSAEALALGVLGRTLALHGDVDGGLRCLRDGIAIADEIGNLQGRVAGVATVGALLARWGRSREALADIYAATRAADEAELRRSLGAQLTAQAARACFALGEWDEADARLADGLARRPAPPVEAALRTIALRLAAARGRTTEAAGLGARVAALVAAVGDPEELALGRVARAEAALADGRPDEVRPLLDAQLADLAAGTEPGPAAAWLAGLAAGAEVDLQSDARAAGNAQGEAEAARRLAAIAGTVASEVGAARGRRGPLVEALVAHVNAEVARAGPSPDRRVTAWEAAVGAWDAIERPYHAAWARYRLAEARLAAGSPRAAIREALQEAAVTAAQLGAVPLAARVDRLARLARIEVDRSHVPGPAHRPDAGQPAASDPLATLGLTPREREILRLVAAGWANARIAGELGISTSTASVHVSNILAKLDVVNRVEAAALAHRLGVVGQVGPA